MAVILRNKSYSMNDLRSERGDQRDGNPLDAVSKALI